MERTKPQDALAVCDDSHLDILHGPGPQLGQHAALVVQGQVETACLQGQAVILLTCLAHRWLRYGSRAAANRAVRDL